MGKCYQWYLVEGDEKDEIVNLKAKNGGRGMKRQIVCDGCQKNNPLSDSDGKVYAGEWVKRIKGKAKRPFICDLCDKEIKTDEKCFAQSMGLDSQPYCSWEQDYITEGP